MTLHSAQCLRAMLLAALIVLVSPTTIAAQDGTRLTVNTVDVGAFPHVAVLVTVIDANGLPVQGLDATAFTLSEDGRPVDDFTLTELHDSTEPISLVIAIDTSDSMRSGYPNTALENTKQAVRAFIGALGPSDLVGLVAFSDEAAEVTPLTADKAAVTQAVDSLEASGGTALYDAIVVSIGLLKDLPAGRKAVILFSDGWDTSSVFSLGEAINEVVRWSIPVYPIGFGNVDASTIMRISNLTGGYAQIEPDSTALGRALESVLATLRHQYRLDFTSGLMADGREHNLLVSLTLQGGQVTGTHTFIAKPNAVLVSLPELADGQIIGGDVRITPEIVAPASVARVEYQLDGMLLANVASAPFELVWDTTAVEPGIHELTVVATDAVGNTGQTAVRLEVRPPLTISWVKPLDGQEIAGTQVLEVAVDSLSGIKQVEFFINDASIGVVTAPPYQITWSAQDAQPGPATLRAQVVDLNNRTAEATISVTVLLQSRSLVFLLALAILVAAVLIVTPIALRRRRARSTTSPQTGARSSVAPSAQFVLQEIQGRQPGHEWPLGSSDLYIGRKAEENDIPAKGLSASRRHAVIRYRDGQYVITNLNRDNVTLVNNQPVQDERVLRPGDLVTIGESVFRFQIRQRARKES